MDFYPNRCCPSRDIFFCHYFSYSFNFYCLNKFILVFVETLLLYLTNLKMNDIIYSLELSDTCKSNVQVLPTPDELSISGCYTSGLLRGLSNNFQYENPKSCSEWLVYCSSVSEVLSYFLLFYTLGLAFFFFYIVPKSSPVYRLTTNFVTPSSWFSSFVSCGVPFFLIFSILYESVFLVFSNENFSSKVSPLFLIEGRQWKWDYRFNFSSLLEYSQKKRVLSRGTNFYNFLGSSSLSEKLFKKTSSIIGSELVDASLRLKTELLKGTRQSSSLRDSLLLSELTHSNNPLQNKGLVHGLFSNFLRQRVDEGLKRLLITNRTLFLPDTPLVKAHITGCDVIHSWTVPSLGIRIDAVPGKVYSVKIPFKHYGIFIGQCSEVCGLRHAYMPITLNFVNVSFFIKQVHSLILLSLDLYFFSYVLKSVTLQ